MRVLVTRPRADAARTAKALADRGFEAFCTPLFKRAALPFVWPQQADALLATSANALRFSSKIPAHILATPLLAVGDATAAAAIHAGFANVRSADGNGEALAALALRALPERATLTYLTGRDRRDAAIQCLTARHPVTTLEVYEVRAVEHLPQDIRRALVAGELDAVLHFSPRASTLFTDLAADANLLSQAQDLLHICISQAATDPRLPKTRVASRPRLDSMLDALSQTLE
jgi:uroporphyrinogen-III synthase